MWLAALCIWGSLLAFSACDSCPESEDAASWLKLKPLGQCDDEENFCPYRITLPPLSIQLPRPFRELEKMAKELQNLKEAVNRLRRDCQDCKERQRAERGGWKDHSEEEEGRAQSPRHNISSTGRQSHHPSGEQAVRIVTSAPPQENTPGTEGIITGGVKRLNHSGLERRSWNIDKKVDSEQATTDRNSELSREVEIFDPSLEETPEGISDVKLVLSPTTEETERELTFQRGELLPPSIPRTKDAVPSATHGSEMSREVKIFNPFFEETPEDMSAVKRVFSPTTDETDKGRTISQGELFESSFPRTKDVVQPAAHGKQQPNILRERNMKNISGIVRRRIQNTTDADGLSSISGDANAKTVDLTQSAGNRRILNFSRTGGPLRPKTYINSRAAKASDEDRLKNPAVVRTHPGFSPVRSGVMRVKETTPHITNRKHGTNSGLTPSTHEEKMATVNLKPGTNSGLTPKEDEKMAIINPKPGTNSGLTPSTHKEETEINPTSGTNHRLTASTEEKMAIKKPKPGTNNGRTPTEDEKMVIINPKPGTNSGLTPSTHKEETEINPTSGTNHRLTPLTEDKMATKNLKLGTNNGLTSTDDEKLRVANLKPGTNSGLTPTEDEKLVIINLKPGTNSGLTKKKTEINPKPTANRGLTLSTEDEKLSVANPQPGTNSGLTSSTHDKKKTITNPKPGTNSGPTLSTHGQKMRLNPLTEDKKLTVANSKPGTNSGLTPPTHGKKTIIIPKPGTNSGFTPPTHGKKTIIIPKPGTNSGLTPSTDGEKTIIIPKPGTNSGLTPSTDGEKTIIIPKPGTNSGLTPSTHEEKTIIIPKPGTNSGLTPLTDGEKTIIIPKPGTNSGLTPSTDGEKTIIIPKPGTNSGLTPTTHEEKMTIVNPKPGTNSGLAPSTHDEKTIINPKPGTNGGLTLSTKDETLTIANPKPDPQTDHENNLKDARQVTMDGEENFRKLNKTVITRAPANRRKENQHDVSHTPQTTNKSTVSVTNRAGQPNLIKAENEHVGFNVGPVLSSKADNSSSAGDADSSSSARQVENDKYLTSIKRTEIIKDQENLRATDVNGANSTFNEKGTNPNTPDLKDQTQSGTFTEVTNEEINYNSLSEGTVTKDILSNSKTTDEVNPTLTPSMKMASTDPTVSTAPRVKSPVVDQGTRSSVPGLISQSIKAKSGEDVVNIQSPNSKRNISKIRDMSNVRFVKNITRLMPNLPKRPGRLPTTVISSGGPKLNTINIMSGNRSAVVPSNISISGRNSYFGRRNSTVMMKPSYIRRKPNVQAETNPSNQNRGFRTNVSPVTQSISPPEETSTSQTKETRDIPHDVKGSHILDNHKLEKNSTELTSLSEIASRNAGDVQDLDAAKHSKDRVAGHSSETVLMSKAVNDTENINNENSLRDSLHSAAPNSLRGKNKQLGLGTTDTSSQHPMGVDKFSSMKNELKPQNLEPTASTLKKELSSVNEKTQPTTYSDATVAVTDHGESTKPIPAVTSTHVKMVTNISQESASTPISFENTVATRELELIKLNEDKVQKYSGDILANPNSVDDVQGTNGERYTVPVVLETLTNVEEIKGSKVFSLSPEDTADGFNAIAVSDEVTQKDKAENELHSTCVTDCNSTPTQQPTTHSRPPLDSERGRGLPQDCADYGTRARGNGVYRVTPRSQNGTFHVFCDMETSGGGWTLIQQRFDGSTSFNRTWDEYKKGFGKLMGEFWLGNDKIHWLTKAKNMSLRIELEDFEGIREHAEYDHFHVANESQRYRLSIGGYSGTAGNAMQFNRKYNHNQMFFTTPDRDNDQYPSGNCGAYYSSGWWFDACMSANLNGKYYHTKYKGVRNGIFWGTWHNITMEYYPTNERQSFKTVKMMIRPQNYVK